MKHIANHCNDGIFPISKRHAWKQAHCIRRRNMRIFPQLHINSNRTVGEGAQRVYRGVSHPGFAAYITIQCIYACIDSSVMNVRLVMKTFLNEAFLPQNPG